ncbi:two-component response regulator ORR33-like [Oryza brachyantha]|uniref:Response regulatory domain-containing protein n=1 Tax=Oryza brachyantha TaxID=4533 RepID=J3MTL2_ORYBR|nr:two-component response regulator ORR33-like [Oryza brachyantha]
MDQEMVALFPGGLRVMLIGDDAKAVRSAIAAMSSTGLRCRVVASYATASAGLRALSSNNVADVQAVLCDVHKVVSSGFDFRLVVETELHIPVIYILSTKDTVAGEDEEFLNLLLDTATYVVRKPLSSDVMAHVWRVVAWRRSCLEDRIPSGGVANVDALAGAHNEDGDNDDGVVIVDEQPQVHYKTVRPGGSRKRQLTIIDVDGNNGSNANCSGEAGAKSTNILEKVNENGLSRQHGSSHLQEYREKQQKEVHADDRRLLQPADSPFLKAILPSLNLSPLNPPPAGLSSVAGSGSSTAAPFQQFQQPADNAVISFVNNAAPVAVKAPPAAFAGSGAAAPFQVPAYQQLQQPFGSNGNAVISFNNIAPAVSAPAPARAQQPPSGVQLGAPPQKLFMGPFSYQGPTPPTLHNHIDLLHAFPPRVTTAMDKGKAPLIELPFGQPVDDLLDGETAYYGGAAPSIGAPRAAGVPQNNAAAGSSFMAPPMQPVFSITSPIMATQAGEGGSAAVVVEPEENAAATAEAAAPNSVVEPFVVLPDPVDPFAPLDGEDDIIMFSLESLLGLGLDDDATMLPLEDAGAATGDAAGGSLDGEEGGWDLDLDDILMNNKNDFEFAFLEDMDGSE